jgi:isopentenyl-diphosphate delta-isomerase
MKDLLIRIDTDNKVIGFESREKCHACPGLLHRAFSVFIFNSQGKLLLQKRSNQKLLWPQVWSNSCCSHPKKDEDLIESAQKRLAEELGFTTQLAHAGSLYYQANFENIGCEHEITQILTGKYDGIVNPNAEETSQIKWIKLDDLHKEISKNPQKYSPWLKLILKQNEKNNLFGTR